MPTDFTRSDAEPYGCVKKWPAKNRGRSLGRTFHEVHMKKVGIEYGGTVGSITYDTGTPVKFEVEFPDDKIQRRVIEYLNTPREYWIPESNRIDDYRVDKDVMPTTDETYFELALCTLMSNTDVKVVW